MIFIKPHLELHLIDAPVIVINNVICCIELGYTVRIVYLPYNTQLYSIYFYLLKLVLYMHIFINCWQPRLDRSLIDCHKQEEASYVELIHEINSQNSLFFYKKIKGNFTSIYY